jgi:hypothetical protein
MNDDFIENILNDLEGTAYWRREKATEYPHDRRNDAAADTLEDLAEAIRADSQSGAIIKLRTLEQELIQYGGTNKNFDFSTLTVECSDYRRRIGFSEFPKSAQEYLATLAGMYQGYLGRTRERGLAEGADEIRQLRDAAADLRSRVSQGSYGDSQLQVFWALTKSAGIILKISNPELGMRAGLGDGFFMSVSRERRRPKLVNFLKALTTIVEVADERLAAIEKADLSLNRAAPGKDSGRDIRIKEDRDDLLNLARALSLMARYEIERLDNERPNDPDAIESSEKHRELLQIFVDGFEKIAAALAAFGSDQPQALLVTKAKDVVRSVSKQVNNWFSINGAEIVDWTVRIPVFTAGVAALGWAGANMTVATTAIGAIVGGQKVADVLRQKKKQSAAAD